MKKARLAAMFILLALLLPLVSCGAGGGVGLVSVTSVYPAQPEVTNEDTRLRLNFKNPAKTEYYYSKVVLDSLGGPEPELVYISSSSSYTVPSMGEWQGSISLFSPLDPGKYRIRYALLRDGQETRHEFEFDVIKKEDANPPRWNANELDRANYNVVVSEHISMVISNLDSILTDERLNIFLECDQKYTYSEFYTLMVLLNGQWYEVPFCFSQIDDLVGRTPPDSFGQSSFEVNLAYDFGPLPAGQYRLVNSFTPANDAQADELIYVDFTLEDDMLSAPHTFK